jgi:hypothetical protein
MKVLISADVRWGMNKRNKKEKRVILASLDVIEVSFLSTGDILYIKLEQSTIYVIYFRLKCCTCNPNKENNITGSNT